jgi:hypothetical protein
MLLNGLDPMYSRHRLACVTSILFPYVDETRGHDEQRVYRCLALSIHAYYYLLMLQSSCDAVFIVA